MSTKHRNNWTFRLMAIGTATGLGLLGCGEAKRKLELAPAEGVVRINGESAENVMVQYLPQVGKNEIGPSSTGVTNETGEFSLVTSDGKPGAVVGKGKILLTDLNDERVPQGQTATKPVRLPSSYGVLGPQTMEVEVGPGAAPLKIKVETK